MKESFPAVVNKIIAAIFALFIIGSIFYRVAEGWTWVDSIYFTILTITTVGHPNLVLLTTASKVFTSFIAIVGISLLLILFGIISSHYFKFGIEK